MRTDDDLLGRGIVGVDPTVHASGIASHDSKGRHVLMKSLVGAHIFHRAKVTYPSHDRTSTDRG